LPPYVDYFIYAFLILLAFCVLRIFLTPMKFALKAALNTILGFIGLIVFNVVGDLIGVTLGINFINAILVGFLGVPGLIILLFIRLILHI